MKLNHKIYGSGQPIIILHGLFGMGDNWRNIAKKLEDHFQSIVVDMRNHGRSPHDPVMDFMTMADDVLELMTGLHIEKASIMGHSMGGKVAMQFALLHPEMVDKLIMVDIAPKYYSSRHEEVIEAIESIQIDQMKERSEVEFALTRFLGRDQSTIQFLMKNLSRVPEGGFEWKANMPVIIKAYENLMEEVKPDKIYAGPVLFVRGENSSYILDEDFQTIRAIFPNSSLATIPNAGHWVHADSPELFVSEILGFLRSSSGS